MAASRIKCFVGALKLGLPLEMDPPRLDWQAMSKAFSEGSKGTGGTPGIDLRFDDSRHGSGLIKTSQASTAFFLHECARLLTENPAHPPRVKKIALVFADKYEAGGDVLGIMFDRGFNVDGETPVDAGFLGVPREGCAVFVETIKKFRKNDADTLTQCQHTAIHELGHVFNLQHVDAASYMAQTEEGPISKLTPGFTGDHRTFLSQCSQSDFVHPGGSQFKDHGTHATADRTSRDPFAGADAVDSGLRLAVSMQRKEFWRFEPVQLNVSISIPEGGATWRRIPNQVDPGYDRFKIWIADPSGERRRYRSPVTYCPGLSTLKIDRREPFVRDIPIFGQSGGYTFRSAGVHTIWAEFVTASGKKITSERESFEVLAKNETSAEYRDIAQVLTQPRLGKALFYGEGSRIATALEDGMALARKYERHPATPAVRYALGRIAASSAARTGAQTAKKYREIAKRSLSEAAERVEALGALQAARALDIVKGKLADLF